MRPRPLLRRLPLLGALATAASAAACPAWAAGLPPLVVHRTDDTTDCPDAVALAALVAAQMKRPALAPAGEVSPGPDRGLDVQIYKSEAGYTAVLQAGGKTRQITDRGTTCGGLSAALAVSIAVLLDSEPLPPEPEAPPPPSPLSPAASAAPAAAAAAPAAASTTAAPSPEPPPPATPVPLEPAPPSDDRFTEGHRVHLWIAASPVVAGGWLVPFSKGVTSFSAGVTGELEVRFGRFSVSAGAIGLLDRTVSFPPGQVAVSLTAGFLRGCGAVLTRGGSGLDETLRLALCLEPIAGAVQGVGQGYKVDRTATLPWGAAGASVLFAQRIWGPVGWGARAALVIPLLKQSFFVDNLGTAFTPSPAGVALDVGLRVSIW